MTWTALRALTAAAEIRDARIEKCLMWTQYRTLHKIRCYYHSCQTSDIIWSASCYLLHYMIDWDTVSNVNIFCSCSLELRTRVMFNCWKRISQKSCLVIEFLQRVSITCQSIVIVNPSLCSSFRLTHPDIVSKWSVLRSINQSCKLHWRIALWLFSFCVVNFTSNFEREYLIRTKWDSEWGRKTFAIFNQISLRISETVQDRTKVSIND